jgi:long-chain acyl-CoA synthetase
MIIRGGHNIAPGEVEEAFYRHRSVVEAAVVGVPHPVLGEDVAAWVVLDETVGTTAEELRAYLLEQLADYKVPRRITLTDALPRNEAGKVLKAQLVSADEQRSQP